MLDVIALSLASVSEDRVPPGSFVDLGRRGSPFVVDVAGPPGSPVLFLVHGLVATSYLNWFPAFAALSQHFRVVAMDLRGHGRGIPLDGRRFRLADCADDIVAVADALRIERVIPVGYSLGGPVSQMVWRRHHDRVAGLVLAATSRNFMGTPQERVFFRSLLAVATVAHYAPVPHREQGRVPTAPAGTRMSDFALSELRRTSPAVVLEALSALGRFSSHEWVGDIDVPTAIVVTSKDRAIGAHRQIKLAAAIPGATIHASNAGHTGCVLGARQFVPVLLDACLSVRRRLGTPGVIHRTQGDGSPTAGKGDG